MISRKLARFLTLCLVLTFTSLLFVMPVQGQATVTTTNVFLPLDLDVLVPCANGGTGEIVRLLGNLHVGIQFVANNNHITFRVHFQPQGVSGVGILTGDAYQGTGVTKDTLTTQNDGGPFEETFVNNFRIIGQGPGNNLVVHETLHVTFNNNGFLTALQDNYSIDCK